MVRLCDIAAAAGVTSATVSAALSGNGRVGTATRRRIQELAEAMDYRPNAAARVLKKKSLYDVGLLIADLRIEMVGSFIQLCDSYGLSHQLELMPETGVPPLLSSGFAEGILYVGELTPDVRAYLAAHPDYPLVVLGEEYPFCVRSNFAGGAQRAIQYFVAQGHRRIAMSCGNLDYDAHRQVRQGLSQAIAEFQLDECEEPCELVGEDPIPRALRWAEEQLDRPNRPTAFFCSGIITARAVIYAALTRNLRVPDDLSIISVASGQDGAGSIPSVSTLEHDYTQLISQALPLLRRRVGGLAIVDPTPLVEPLIVFRNSTAPQWKG